MPNDTAPTTESATVVDFPRGAASLAVVPPAAPLRRFEALKFTAEQMQMMRDTLLSGASEAEASFLIEVARLRGLNPIMRQIHFVKRWDTNKGREVWAYQTSIDGLRSIAERTGLYDGQDEPEFERDAKGAPVACRVRVYRKDVSRAFVGVAYFSEYVQTKKDGTPNNMWATKPHIMLAKCAEALGLRKAFPEDTGGLYTDDEIDITPREHPAPPPSRPMMPPAPDVVGDIVNELDHAHSQADLDRLKPIIVKAKPTITNTAWQADIVPAMARAKARVEAGTAEAVASQTPADTTSATADFPL